MIQRSWMRVIAAASVITWISGDARGVDHPVRLALLSDPHVSVEEQHADYVQRFEQVIVQVNDSQVDAVLIAGDLANHGRAEEFEAYRRLAQRLNAPVFCVPGNHDVGNKVMPDQRTSLSPRRLDVYRQHVGELFYTSPIAPGVRVVGATSSLMGSGLEQEQLQWEFLDKHLAAADNERVIFLMHYPLFVEKPDEPGGEYFNLEPEPRARLMDLLKRHGVRYVFTGHLHWPMQRQWNGVHLIGAPPISFGLPRGRQPEGWTLIELNTDGTLTVQLRYLDSSPASQPTGDEVQGEQSAAAAQLANEAATRSANAPQNPVPPSSRVHIFYYNWYGAPRHDGGYIHWEQGGFTPPQDIGANFYPLLGPYSSGDPSAVRQHMRWIREAGIGVLSLTWWGRGSREDRLTPVVLDAAAAEGLKVNFHLEPYPDRTPSSTMDDVRYLLARYADHPAFYVAPELGGRSMFYIFRALDAPAAAWADAVAALRHEGHNPVLLAQTSDLQFVTRARFDGGYSYDVLTPFRNERMFEDWQRDIVPRFTEAGKVFIPAVGPGYWDDRAVPNGANEPPAAVSRDDGTGRTYRRGWEAAARAGAYFITITSFNEWHEGTQIEPATAHVGKDGYRYPAYPEGPMQYLQQTAELVGWYLRQPIDPPTPPVGAPSSRMP